MAAKTEAKVEAVKEEAPKAVPAAKVKEVTASVEAKASVAPSNRTQALLASDVISKMNKKWGTTMVLQASEDNARTVHRLPTGVAALDAALGGGWATGRMHLVYGHKSSCKTSTICRTIAEAQKLCANCYTTRENGKCACGKYRDLVAAFIDVEGTFDHKWADLLGIDRTRLVYSRPEYAEQSLDILELLLRTQETDIIALDSIAFLTPQKEIEESNDKETMGVQPRVVGKAIRKLTAALNFVKNETSRSPTIFFTNQIRMKIGLVFGSPESNPGGLAPGFAATSEVRFNPIKIKMDEDTGRPLEGEVSFRVEKNKSDVPKIEGKYRLILTATEVKKKGEVYDEDWIAEQAHRHGIVTGSGAHWSCLGESFPAKSAIERRMLTDHAFKAKVRGAVMTAISLL